MQRRSILSSSLAALVLALGAQTAQAQNVLMTPAETINTGNFKISAFPTVLLGEDGADSNWGVVSRFGYGFTNWFDMEGKVGFFDGINMYGLDAEAWVVKHRPLDVSVS